MPYRYTKEFMHPVLRAGQVAIEPFYLSVLYRECDIVRDGNRKIFENFGRYGSMKTAKIGRGQAWSFSHREFFRLTTELLQKDIYALARTPANSAAVSELTPRMLGWRQNSFSLASRVIVEPEQCRCVP